MNILFDWSGTLAHAPRRSWELMEGAEQLIRHLSLEHRLFIVSSLEPGAIRQVLAKTGLDKCFADIAGGYSDKVPVIGRLLSRYQLAAFESMYIGDTTSDMLAAKNNRMQTGAAAYGYGNEDALA